MSRGFHVGLRKEAHDWLTNKMGGRSHPSEAYVREQQQKSRDVGDEEAAEMWGRLHWKLYGRERNAQQVRRTIVLAKVSE